jgi:hypothetical protein
MRRNSDNQFTELNSRRNISAAQNARDQRCTKMHKAAAQAALCSGQLNRQVKFKSTR